MAPQSGNLNILEQCSLVRKSIVLFLEYEQEDILLLGKDLIFGIMVDTASDIILNHDGWLFAPLLLLVVEQAVDIFQPYNSIDDDLLVTELCVAGGLLF